MRPTLSELDTAIGRLLLPSIRAGVLIDRRLLRAPELPAASKFGEFEVLTDARCTARQIYPETTKAFFAEPGVL